MLASCPAAGLWTTEAHINVIVLSIPLKANEKKKQKKVSFNTLNRGKSSKDHPFL